MPITAQELIRQKEKTAREEAERRKELVRASQAALDKLAEKQKKSLERARKAHQKEYRAEYQKVNETITCISPRTLHLKQLLEFRPGRYSAKPVSVSQYIITAILEKLERDGIDIHMFDE